MRGKGVRIEHPCVQGAWVMFREGMEPVPGWWRYERAQVAPSWWPCWMAPRPGGVIVPGEPWWPCRENGL